jgi:hypothetical protein
MKLSCPSDRCSDMTVDINGFSLLEDTIDLETMKNYQEINRDIYLDLDGIEQTVAVGKEKVTEQVPSDTGNDYRRVKNMRRWKMPLRSMMACFPSGCSSILIPTGSVKEFIP